MRKGWGARESQLGFKKGKGRKACLPMKVEGGSGDAEYLRDTQLEMPGRLEQGGPRHQERSYRRSNTFRRH